MKIKWPYLLLVLSTIFMVTTIIQLSCSDYPAGSVRQPSLPTGVHSISQATQNYYKQNHAVREITLEQAHIRWEAKDAVFVDARTQEMYKDAHIPGALNVPADKLNGSFAGFKALNDSAVSIIVYCSSTECIASGIVASYLIDQGYTDVYHFSGGLLEWENHHYPVEIQE